MMFEMGVNEYWMIRKQLYVKILVQNLFPVTDHEGKDNMLSPPVFSSFM